MAGISADVTARTARAAGLMRTALDKVAHQIKCGWFIAAVETAESAANRADRIMAGELPPDETNHPRQDER